MLIEKTMLIATVLFILLPFLIILVPLILVMLVSFLKMTVIKKEQCGRHLLELYNKGVKEINFGDSMVMSIERVHPQNFLEYDDDIILKIKKEGEIIEEQRLEIKEESLYGPVVLLHSVSINQYKSIMCL